ncbi:MAG TPA: DUF3846 domain-containing protein [Candidatus Dietzia merdigallinarum]|nr:DUF3846 domain-containing protein [Candidatus Dietzia merdigallinarum]
MQDTSTGILIRTDGTVATVTVDQVAGSALGHMQELIEASCVDVVALDDAPFGAYDAWVDDEGALIGPQNVMATVILAELAGQGIQPIFGHVLILSRQDEHVASLSSDQIEYVQSIHALAEVMPTIREAIVNAHHKTTAWA